LHHTNAKKQISKMSALTVPKALRKQVPLIAVQLLMPNTQNSRNSLREGPGVAEGIAAAECVEGITAVDGG
jgi:hypothetical protein